MSDALERTKTRINEYDFDELFSFVEGERLRAVRRFELIVEAATPLDLETAVALWITRVRTDVRHPVNQEHLVSVFTKTLRTAQAKAREVYGPEDQFCYDGVPLKRTPRVIASVPLEAGRTPKGVNYGKGREHLAAYSQQELDADIWELVRRLKQVINWFNRNEGSKYDMTGYIDHITRGLAAQLDGKRQYLKKLKAEMRDIERRANAESEFDQAAWQRLSNMHERILMSGYMLKDALEAHNVARTDTYAYCGMDMNSFRSFEQIKKDRQLKKKMLTFEIDADRLLGMTADEFKRWRIATGIDQDIANDSAGDDSPKGGGVDALPDERTAASLRDVRNTAERHDRHGRSLATDEHLYRRRKPRAVPKKDAVTTPSGAKGERHKALTEKVRKSGLS